MEKLHIGQIITTPQNRDAVHMAIAPVVAGDWLQPGEHVRLEDGKAVADTYDKCIGVVDPFLRGGVSAGESFWLFLYPGSITGLRHEWTHPALPNADPVATSAPGDSEIWLRAYAMRLSPYDTPSDAYTRLIDGLLREKEVFAHGSDLHGLYELEDAEDLRRHAEAVLGISINWGDYSFSCSC